jgi:hypothetical protein
MWFSFNRVITIMVVLAVLWAVMQTYNTKVETWPAFMYPDGDKRRLYTRPRSETRVNFFAIPRPNSSVAPPKLSDVERIKADMRMWLTKSSRINNPQPYRDKAA